jgi:hypothetical protein
VSPKREPSAALQAALERIAAADAPEVLEDARARAREKAAELIGEALVQELLRAAGEIDSGPSRRRKRSPAPREKLESADPHQGAAAVEPADAPEPQEGHAWWAYCVIRVDDADAIADELDGVEPGMPVEVVAAGELAALVSKVPLAQYNDEQLRAHLEDLEWVERIARAHEAVLERVLQSTTLVPLRLCTLYRNLDGVRRLLRESRETLIEGLDQVEGCVELGVKVFAVAGGVPVGAEGASDAEAQSSGAEYLSRRRRERDRAERAREERAQSAEAVHERVSALSRAAIANPPQRREAHGRDADMLLNGAYLVERDAVSDVADALADLRAQWEPRGLELELTGPWPAYNFVTGAAGIVP